MGIFGIIFLSVIFKFCQGEQPLSSCEVSQPFKTMGNTCASFNEICLKKNDPECTNFQNMCGQCPSSNYSFLLFSNMMNLKDRIVKQADKIEQIYTCLWLLVIVDIFVFILIVFEIRFKIFTKCCSHIFKKDYRSKHRILDSRKVIRERESNFNLILNETKELIERSLNSNMDLKLNETKELFEKSWIMKNQSAEFKISGADRPIFLSINKNENVIQVKKNLCAKWPAAKQDDYKIMNIKYNGKSLYDHGYFTSINYASNARFHCELDDSTDSSDFLILKLQGDLCVPELVKIRKDETILNLKTLISSLSNFTSKVNLILKEMKNGNELKDEMTLKDILKDDDWIAVITKRTEKIAIQSMFDEKDSCSIEYSNMDLISAIKNKIKTKLKYHSEDLVLLWNGINLEDEKYIHDYDLNNKYPIKFCRLKILDGMEITGNNMAKHDFCQLFRAKQLGKDILVQKYTFKSNVIVHKSQVFIQQLITYHTIHSNSSFVSLLGIYLSSRILYISMENMSEGTIAKIVKKESTLKENEIAKWSRQILDGLKYLHDNNIIHKNLKPSSIFVDDNRNLKLSSFNIIENLYSVEESVIDTKPFALRYWSPETLKSGQFSIKSDIWSFGAVLTFIVTKEKPYSNLGDSECAVEITKHCKIEYNRENISKELIDFIDSCLIGDQNQRPDIDSLLENSFIRRCV